MLYNTCIMPDSNLLIWSQRFPLITLAGSILSAALQNCLSFSITPLFLLLCSSTQWPRRPIEIWDVKKKKEQFSLVEIKYEVVSRRLSVSKECTDVHLNLCVRRQMRKIDLGVPGIELVHRGSQETQSQGQGLSLQGSQSRGWVQTRVPLCNSYEEWQWIQP